MTKHPLLSVLLISLSIGCSSIKKLENCTDDQGDCCESNEQCLRFFGGDYPFCADGHCVECTSDGHCLEEEVCLTDDSVGYFCGFSDTDPS